MKKFFFLLLFFPTFILSQDFSKATKADSITICYVTTVEGTKLKGLLLGETPEQITVIDITLGEVSINKKKIRSFIKDKPGSWYEIELDNDNAVVGKIISINKEHWMVDTKSLGVVEVRTADIKDFSAVDNPDENSQFDLANIDAGRYFAGPAPFAVKKNKLVYQNTMVVFNGLSYGLFNDFTISGGVLGYYIPYGNVKFAAEITHNVHLAVGAMGIGFPIITSGGSMPLVGAAYALGAIGNSENHFSAGAYYLYDGVFNGDGFSDSPSFSVAGIKRINERVSFMVEDYVIATRTRVYYPYPSYGYHYTTDYVNAGVAGVKIFFKKGLFGAKHSVLNLGMLWIVGGGIGFGNGSFIAFPIVSYSGLGKK